MKVSVDELADAVIETLGEVKDISIAELSWRSRVTDEASDKIQVTVHSQGRYMLAHLLEHGHAKRGGGRVRAIPHIEPATEKNMATIEAEIKRGIESELR